MAATRSFFRAMNQASRNAPDKADAAAALRSGRRLSRATQSFISSAAVIFHFPPQEFSGV
jgi:hypothetical protein